MHAETLKNRSCSLLNTAPVPQLLELLTKAVDRKRYF